jgi:hypothetical protein
MREDRCGFRWVSIDPTYLEMSENDPNGQIPHECIRKERHNNDHVCYCGEDKEKSRIEKMVEVKNKL